MTTVLSRWYNGELSYTNRQRYWFKVVLAIILAINVISWPRFLDFHSVDVITSVLGLALVVTHSVVVYVPLIRRGEHRRLALIDLVTMGGLAVYLAFQAFLS